MGKGSYESEEQKQKQREKGKVDLFVEFSFSGICFVYRLFDLANAGIAVFFPFKVGRNHNCQIHRDQEFCGSVYQRPVF